MYSSTLEKYPLPRLQNEYSGLTERLKWKASYTNPENSQQSTGKPGHVGLSLRVVNSDCFQWDPFFHILEQSVDDFVSYAIVLCLPSPISLSHYLMLNTLHNAVYTFSKLRLSKLTKTDTHLWRALRDSLYFTGLGLLMLGTILPINWALPHNTKYRPYLHH